MVMTALENKPLWGNVESLLTDYGSCRLTPRLSNVTADDNEDDVEYEQRRRGCRRLAPQPLMLMKHD